MTNIEKNNEYLKCYKEQIEKNKDKVMEVLKNSYLPLLDKKYFETRADLQNFIDASGVSEQVRIDTITKLGPLLGTSSECLKIIGKIAQKGEGYDDILLKFEKSDDEYLAFPPNLSVQEAFLTKSNDGTIFKVDQNQEEYLKLEETNFDPLMVVFFKECCDITIGKIDSSHDEL